jgi:hypothetical protein
MEADLSPEGHLREAFKRAVDDRIVKLPGPLTLSAFYGDSAPQRFKTARFMGGEEFTLMGVREGKRSAGIFLLEAMDAVDYVHVEVETGRLDQQIPELGRHVVATLAAYLTEAQALAEIDTLDAPFIPSTAPLTSAISTFQRAIGSIRELMKTAAETKREREAASAYADDELWGTW